MDVTTLTGIAAACCTTASYFPQLKKCWETEETSDLSLGMFLTLFAGIALWVVYGILRSDSVVLIANAISLCLLSGILYFKVREMLGEAQEEEPSWLVRFRISFHRNSARRWSVLRREPSGRMRSSWMVTGFSCRSSLARQCCARARVSTGPTSFPRPRRRQDGCPIASSMAKLLLSMPTARRTLPPSRRLYPRTAARI